MLEKSEKIGVFRVEGVGGRRRGKIYDRELDCIGFVVV